MKLFQFFLFFFFTNLAFSQVIGKGDFVSFSKKHTRIGSYKLKANGCIQNINYLGVLISSENIEYKVFTSHKNITGKGINDLVFVSNKNEEILYRLDMPSDFPIAISENKLTFKNDRGEKKYLTIEKLLDVFCTPFGCFEKT